MTPLLTPRHMAQLTADQVALDKARNIMQQTLHNPKRSISRTSYNALIASADLYEGEMVTLWFQLNSLIWRDKIKIIEDGSEIREVALGFDGEHRVVGVFAL